MVIGSNERSWSVDVPFDHFGQNHPIGSRKSGQNSHKKAVWSVDVPLDTRPEVVKLAKKKTVFIENIFKIYKKKKNIPLQVWGRLGPARVSQILPCHDSISAIVLTTSQAFNIATL